MAAPDRVRVVVVGSSNTDLVLACPRLPGPGETLLGGDFHRFHGGKGANQAVAAARAGARVTFVGARGDDDLGRAVAKALRREGIDTRHFRIRAKRTSGLALILLGGKERENIIAVARSANDLLAARDVTPARGAFRRARVIVAQLEVPLPAVLATAVLAKRLGIPFLLNPAPAQRLPERLLRLVHTSIPSCPTKGRLSISPGKSGRTAPPPRSSGPDAARSSSPWGRRAPCWRTGRARAIFRPQK